VGLIAYWILQGYFYVLMARFVIDLVRSINPVWRPRGLLIVPIELVMTVTDPPLKVLRRVIKPVRVGPIAFDLAWTVLLFAIIILRNLTVFLP
jgi:YggT family protein